MDDPAIANRCRQFDALFEKALEFIDRNEEQFVWFYGSAAHVAKPLIVAAGNNGLDAWPIQIFAGTDDPPPTTSIDRHNVLLGAASAIALLKKVVETKSPPEKRRLVSLIYRFLHEMSHYFSAAQSIALNEEILKKERRQTLQEMALGVRRVLGQDELDRIVELDEKQNEARAAMAQTGRLLAEELIRNQFSADGILRVLHRADGGGGGVKAVYPIWEEVKIDLQKTLLQISTTAEVGKVQEPQTGISDDLMTREEIAAASGIALQTLKNQNKRFLGPPHVSPGKGRGRKHEWHYLQILPQLEKESGASMPTLEEARRIIIAKQNVERVSKASESVPKRYQKRTKDS